MGIFCACKDSHKTSSHLKCEDYYVCVILLLVPDDLDVFSVLALAVPPLAVHDGGVHVGWGEGVGFIQQRDHTEQDGPERSGERLKYGQAIQGEDDEDTEEHGGRKGKMEVRRDKRH